MTVHTHPGSEIINASALPLSFTALAQGWVFPCVQCWKAKRPGSNPCRCIVQGKADAVNWMAWGPFCKYCYSAIQKIFVHPF